MPPVAGAIQWKNEIYRRVKQPIVKFIQSPQVWNEEQLNEVKEEYVRFAKRLDQFQQDLMNAWLKES